MDTTNTSQSPGMTRMVLLGSLAIAACSNTSTPYESYLACDRVIAAADSLSDIEACHTENRQQWLLARAKNDDSWFSSFRSNRPVVDRLHEMQSTDIDNESILLVVGHTRAGQPAAIQVGMRREGGSWKIDYEDAVAKGAAGTDARPVQVSLKPDDAEEWYPGELSGHTSHRSDGTCWLKISHVFQFPNVRIIVDCERLTTPGTYQVDELADDDISKAESRLAAVWDAKHVWYGVDSGELTISDFDGEAISGEFYFAASNPVDRISISGTFSNLPFNPGD